MKWRGRRSSTRVQDARGQQMSGGGSGGLGMLLNLVIRVFGMKGLLVIAAVGFVGWQMGLISPSMLTGGGELQQVTYEPSAEEEDLFNFVGVVLADTEDVWSQEFSNRGADYMPPDLVIYRNQFPTACGTGDARMGPFYCPADRKIYIDLGFYSELERQFEAPGDFAQAYVIAHEVGHHIQNLLGISDEVARTRGSSEYNQQSVRLELQADFLAGVWAHHNRRYLDHGDIEEAMVAANAIGDDAIQARTQGRVVPHAFTHGTSEQRQRWFAAGLKSGRLEDGDTFKLPYDSL